jgi:hypothetical protein
MGPVQYFNDVLGYGLISRCPIRNVYERYFCTSSDSIPYQQAVSPKGAYKCSLVLSK